MLRPSQLKFVTFWLYELGLNYLFVIYSLLKELWTLRSCLIITIWIYWTGAQRMLWLLHLETQYTYGMPLLVQSRSWCKLVKIMVQSLVWAGDQMENTLESVWVMVKFSCGIPHLFPRLELWKGTQPELEVLLGIVDLSSAREVEILAFSIMMVSLWIPIENSNY